MVNGNHLCLSTSYSVWILGLSQVSIGCIWRSISGLIEVSTHTHKHTYCIATGICGPTGARAEERLEPTNLITTYAGIETWTMEDLDAPWFVIQSWWHCCVWTRVYSKHKMLPQFPIKINSSNYFQRSSYLIFHHTPRNREATGWMESLAVQKLLL